MRVSKSDLSRLYCEKPVDFQIHIAKQSIAPVI